MRPLPRQSGQQTPPGSGSCGCNKATRHNTESDTQEHRVGWEQLASSHTAAARHPLTCPHAADGNRLLLCRVYGLPSTQNSLLRAATHLCICRPGQLSAPGTSGKLGSLYCPLHTTTASNTCCCCWPHPGCLSAPSCTLDTRQTGLLPILSPVPAVLLLSWLLPSAACCAVLSGVADTTCVLYCMCWCNACLSANN